MSSKTPTDPIPATPSPLVWTTDVTDVPANGMEFKRIATDEERAAVAKTLDLLACDKLTATYRVRRGAGEGYGVRGKFTADVIQACVVTLAPVYDTITQDFAVEFHPASALVDDATGATDLDTEIDMEPIDGTTLTIGRVIFEELAAALNPYPRRPGAEYVAPSDAAAAAKPNPFAVLEKLKTNKPTPKA
jgi:uncharacterized metal-binding protein YceD (DUF177 family)